MQARFGGVPCILGSYSLGGLFSLWAACECDSFAGVAASSPSVWIKGWLQYAQEHPIRAKHVYMSFGDKEELVRNKAIAQVGNNIREYYAMLGSLEAVPPLWYGTLATTFIMPQSAPPMALCGI